MEFHVAGELQLKARRPKSVDKYGTWRNYQVEVLFTYKETKIYVNEVIFVKCNYKL